MTTAIHSGSYNGLTWGPGTAYRVMSSRGFDDLPQIISLDAPRSMKDGTLAGEDLLGEHFVSVELLVAPVNSTDAGFRSLIDAANAAFSRQGVPLPLRWWNLERYVMARPRERAWSPMDIMWSDHSATVNVRWVLSDPTIYIGVP